MAAVSVHARLTAEELTAAIEQLEPTQADRVIQRLLRVQARRRVSGLSDHENELLREVFREKRSGFQERFDVLSAKSRALSLPPEERQEYLTLVEESEAFTVRRLKALGELALLRQTTLPSLMKQLGLKAPPVV